MTKKMPPEKHKKPGPKIHPADADRLNKAAQLARYQDGPSWRESFKIVLGEDGDGPNGASNIRRMYSQLRTTIRNSDCEPEYGTQDRHQPLPDGVVPDLEAFAAQLAEQITK